MTSTFLDFFVVTAQFLLLSKPIFRNDALGKFREWATVAKENQIATSILLKFISAPIAATGLSDRPDKIQGRFNLAKSIYSLWVSCFFDFNSFSGYQTA
ncbi:MAG: hypothetical protein ABJC04_05375 [Verrucomicrobiota bacterium]